MAMKTLIQVCVAAFVLSLAAACIPVPAFAQNASLGTNLAGYANFGTLNCEASYAVARRWSITAGLRYNPFTYSGGVEEGPREFRQRTVALGTRYWPWHIFSGWWLAAKAQYQEYNILFGVWAGKDWYTLYACPSCGRTIDKGDAKFLMLNEILLGLTYVF